MNMRTAESVSPKHPDKICDRISDAVLDACLEQDPDSRVAIETMGGHGIITVTGELTTKAHVNIREVARKVVDDKYGIQVNVVEQSPEIANGVDTGGAGDQGIMIGYATNETPEMLSLEVVLSRNLNKYVYSRFPFDGKTQVTLKGNKVISVVCSFQNTTRQQLTDTTLEWLNNVSLGGVNVEGVTLYMNPAGDWNVGGFEADTGLTGRKLAVDNYGPSIPIGGGCFSGKDPSKVDRSAAYMARKVAVDYLKEYMVDEVFVRLAYAIGHDQPVEATVTLKDSKGEVSKEIKGYDLSPHGIIKSLDLKKPIYAKTAEYGHFGHGFSWER